MRDDAIGLAFAEFDSGRFFDMLARRVARPTESQNPERAGDLIAYLEHELVPDFNAMGFICSIWPEAKGPFLLAERIEDPSLPTVFSYGHGDVVHGQAAQWREGCSPWRLTEDAGAWFGRGVADNKGQHTVNMASMQAVLRTRGKLGFNVKFLIEMGEEVSSPGLREFCASHRDRLGADVFIASDGPRLEAGRPTIFLGSRGDLGFTMSVEAHGGAHHSGNWGGLLSNPGIELANAIACVAGPTGQIRIPEWVPPDIPVSVRRALADCGLPSSIDGTAIEAWWGEPGLTPAERVYGWSSFEVLAFVCGNPEAPVNAIPARAWARCQLRFVVGVDSERILPALRRHLDRHGFSRVEIAELEGEEVLLATRLDPDDPWVSWAVASMARSTGMRPAVLPIFGGSLPNDIFSETLGLPTIWIPHSYPGCSQHAPDERVPRALLREALGLMTGLYYDLGDVGLHRTDSGRLVPCAAIAKA